MTTRVFLRQATVAIAVALVAPAGLAILDLAPSAMAGGKGNGHANDHSDSKGPKGGHSTNHGNASNNQSASTGSDLNKGQAKKAEKCWA